MDLINNFSFLVFIVRRVCDKRNPGNILGETEGWDCKEGETMHPPAYVLAS